MVEDVSFESAAYFEGKTQKYSFEGEDTTVLAFFPGAFTGVCTDEMCKFRDNMSQFNDFDVEVVGVSVDTPFALEEFSKQHDLEFPLVSDTDKTISEKFGVKMEMPGLDYSVSGRAVFVVEDGEVVYSEVLENPSNMPDFEALTKELAEL